MTMARPMTIRPINDAIIVQRIKEEDSVIIRPEIAQDKKGEGRVVAIGPGKRTEGVPEGFPVGLHFDVSYDHRSGIQVGQIVIFDARAGMPIKDGAEEYLILREEDIFAVREVVTFRGA